MAYTNGVNFHAGRGYRVTNFPCWSIPRFSSTMDAYRSDVNKMVLSWMRSGRMIALTTMFGLSFTDHSYAQCGDDQAIWATEKDGVRNIVYGSEGVGYGSEVTLEEWRNSKLAWRGRGKVTCSNGASICRIMIENNSRVAGSDTTAVEIETIDENRDGLSDWVVLSALGQHLYYTGGAKVDWFNGFRGSEFERITPPNIYRFLACRRNVASEQNEPLKYDPHALYALPAVCSMVKEGANLASITYIDNNDGIWWMRGEEITGHEYTCRIKSTKDNVLDIHCDMGEFGIWDDRTPFTMTSTGVRLHTSPETPLDLCIVP